MRHKLTLALILALIALFLPTSAVRRSAAWTGPAPSISCECIAYGRLLCQVYVVGGTAPYTYQWGPPPITGGGEWQIVPCSGSGTRTISVTVTDANGEIGYFSSPFQCCGAVDPK
jgi:hypothetical protein